MEKETINDRIRYIIEKEGHTISSFARKINIGDQTIRSITKDRNKPSYELIVKIIENFEWVEKSEIDIDKKKLYSVISTQQKTIDSQQKTIDRLTAKLVQELSEEPSKKVANVG